MGFFNDLVRCVATVQGLDEMTVRGIGIKVRDGGFIEKGGRGLSAARMNSKDAASLIIGVSSYTTAIKAAEVVETYSNLKLRGINPKTKAKGFLKDILIGSRDFGSALSMLIELCTPRIGNVDQLADVVSKGAGLSKDVTEKLKSGTVFDQLVGIEIGFIRPFAAATVEVIDRTTSEIILKAEYGMASENSEVDRYEITKISQKTIRALGGSL